MMPAARSGLTRLRIERPTTTLTIAGPTRTASIQNVASATPVAAAARPTAGIRDQSPRCAAAAPTRMATSAAPTTPASNTAVPIAPRRRAGWATRVRDPLLREHRSAARAVADQWQEKLRPRRVGAAGGHLGGEGGRLHRRGNQAPVLRVSRCQPLDTLVRAHPSEAGRGRPTDRSRPEHEASSRRGHSMQLFEPRRVRSGLTEGRPRRVRAGAESTDLL